MDKTKVPFPLADQAGRSPSRFAVSAGSRARNDCGMSNEVGLEKFVRMGSGRTGTRPSWRPCRAAVASPTSTLIRLLDFADLTAKLHPSQVRLGLMGPV